MLSTRKPSGGEVKKEREALKSLQLTCTNATATVSVTVSVSADMTRSYSTLPLLNYNTL
jgi:hypothetical protein